MPMDCHLYYLLGIMEITRTFQFKSFQSDCQQTAFDKIFCKKFIESFPEVEQKDGHTDEEKISTYLSDIEDDKSSYDNALEVAFDNLMVNGFTITHYVSAIRLGASRYTVNRTNKTETTATVDGNIDVVEGIGIGGGLERNKIKIFNESSEKNIGHIDEVEIGNGEALVEYDILPVSVFFSQKKVKELINEAILLHIKSASKQIEMVI